MAAIGLGNVVNHLPHPCSISIHKATSTLQIKNMLFNIFSFLSIQDLNSCCLVNHCWEEVHSSMLWNMSNSSANLIPLYQRISYFINQLTQEHLSTDSFIKKENPQLNQYHYSMFIMPTPIVLYRNHCISIFDTTNIQIRQIGKAESTFLVDDVKDKPKLTHLGAEGKYVFAFTECGKVIQWDYQRKEKIRTIRTTCSIENERFGRKKTLFGHFTKGNFCIKDGKIVIQDSSDGSIDLIHYNNPTNITRLTGNKSLIIRSKIIIEKERIITMNTNSICTWNLVDHTREILYILENSSFLLKDIEIDNNILYAVDNNHYIHMINLKTKEKKFLRYSKLEGYSSIDKIVVIRNLLFGRSFSEKTKDLNVIRVFNLDINQNRLINLETITIDFLTAEEQRSSIIKKLISKFNISETPDNTKQPPQLKKKSSKCIIA